MKRRTRRGESVRAHYDATVAVSRDQYDTKALADPAREYPANYFRLRLLLDSFRRKKLRRVFEVGVGEGTPLIALARSGMDVRGLDIAPKMVAASKQNLLTANMDPERVFRGDIRDPKSYAARLKGLPLADGLLAMGVMPHVEDDVAVLKNMGRLVKKGGTVFVEFRNLLFSLFTQNRYTKAFVLDELLCGVAPRLKTIVSADLERRLRTDQPPLRTRLKGSFAPGYDAILSKFHNPFEIPACFHRAGFMDLHFLWYHYHPAMPYLSKRAPRLFRREAIKLEREQSGWRGYFLCSAFVVEAIKR